MGNIFSSELSSDQDNAEAHTVSGFPEAMAVEQQGLQPKRLRNARVTILNEILKEKIKLNEDLVKENNAILKNFLDTFIPEMRKDKTFDLLFQCIYYTGSYYSDLRISQPDEYDLNLLLKLPSKLGTLTTEYHTQVPSYVKYKITDEKCISNENGLKKLFENGFLIPNKVRIWIQSVVDKALTTYKPPTNVVQVKCSASGPARTIILKKRNGIIDIDLVPAIEYSLNLKPPGIDGRVYAKVKDSLQCFLVPKPYQPTKQAPVNANECSRLWRAHYPKAESLIIHNLGCVKPVIKLLKLLRDKENWKIIASYYLKTIVLWMIIEEPKPESWKMDRIGDKFMQALCALDNCVEKRQIRYFFSSRYNLLEKLNETQAMNIHYRLRSIINDINKDDNNLWGIFGCKPTFYLP